MTYLPSKCMCSSSVCLWIHFPFCFVTPQLIYHSSDGSLQLDPHSFFHLVHNPAAGEQQQVLLTNPLMPLHVTGGLLMYMFTLSYMFMSASTRVCTYMWAWLNVMQWTNSIQWSVYFCNPIHKSRIRRKRWSNMDKLCS